MPIAKKLAAEQLRRCNGLNFRPMDDVSVTEITDTLAQVANSADDAGEIVGTWLRENVDYPKPSQLIEVARRMIEERKNKVRTQGCEACDYTGHRPVTVAQPGTSLPYVLGVRSCDCALGRLRAQKWAENRGAA